MRARAIIRMGDSEMARAATLTSMQQTIPERTPELKPELNPPPKHRVLGGMRSIKRSRALRAMYVKAFRAMQSLGLSVTPVHFYFPVPDLNQLRANTWPGGPGESVVDFDMPAQLRRLETWREFADE